MRHSSILNKGFSLVELLVVLSIFLIITSVVLFNQNKFSSDISITNVAYSIALEIRQAQVSGILVGQGRDDFDKAFGVHFMIENNQIVFQNFKDYDDKLNYDLGEGGASQQLSEGNIILSVCTYPDGISDAGKKCITPSNSGDIGTVDIMYKRPEPSAIIIDTSSANANDRRKRVEVIVQSSLGDRTRTIKAYNTGQISVYNQ